MNPFLAFALFQTQFCIRVRPDLSVPMTAFQAAYIMRAAADHADAVTAETEAMAADYVIRVSGRPERAH